MIIGGLMTLYNEVEYADYAIKSALNQVDYLSIVEGAYQETILTNPKSSPRSTDGTIGIIDKYKDHPKVNIIYANEFSDPQQRNKGIPFLHDMKCDWMVIIDGDEVWDDDEFDVLRERLCNTEFDHISLNIDVFVNDFKHYTKQTMPRCFRMKDDLIFLGDNHTNYHGNAEIWTFPTFFHYAYVKSLDRFTIKKKWWECRGGSDWFVDAYGVYSSPNHQIYEFTGDHPEIMKSHPKYIS